ncbi:hypothetical protein KL930_000406 [Ogataea haglerorum]|uniref:Uncharacterized protein n=1 Tax=Ogataea haglerorum TaxID=1937702 RepID=A0AAN6D4N2_9ASCO|nr:hypothetical protein KL913_004059 [Ogataea haglerorum]KAG7715724.1 hypothetical protein KL949_004141 [Ogataea haglerorum]KAG7726881.1 hypothetical protein KL933_003164 [Ogataea haglerorum]KAG7733227.1 hypothetical protein KL948_001730 [Ogataea haglerorum]KAG7741342.1 hypothetical protein KL932_002629 [Ogataea haglerorum]
MKGILQVADYVGDPLTRRGKSDPRGLLLFVRVHLAEILELFIGPLMIKLWISNGVGFSELRLVENLQRSLVRGKLGASWLTILNGRKSGKPNSSDVTGSMKRKYLQLKFHPVQFCKG